MRIIKNMVFYIGKWVGGFWLARKVTKSSLRILCYHGFELENETSFRPKLFIKRDTFLRRLEVLRQYQFCVVPLGEAIKKMKAKSLPDRAVVITIDDGFFGVLSCATPLLRQYGFPATVYITTYYSQKEVPVFRLAVQYLFWRTSLTYVDIGVILGKDWGTVNLANFDEKQRVEWSFIQFGETKCTEVERQELCRKLGLLLQVDYAFVAKNRILSLLSPLEIASLDQYGIDVQLHTHRHQFPEQDEILAKKEIQENRAALQSIVKEPLNHFCYPSGIYSPDQWKWLSDLGIESATTCEVGLNQETTHPLGLKRFLDGENISQIEFEAEISGFADLLRSLFGKTSKANMVNS